MANRRLPLRGAARGVRGDGGGAAACPGAWGAALPAGQDREPAPPTEPRERNFVSPSLPPLRGSEVPLPAGARGSARCQRRAAARRPREEAEVEPEKEADAERGQNSWAGCDRRGAEGGGGARHLFLVVVVVIVVVALRLSRKMFPHNAQIKGLSVSV